MDVKDRGLPATLGACRVFSQTPGEAGRFAERVGVGEKTRGSVF